jgi:hypothetical protein
LSNVGGWPFATFRGVAAIRSLSERSGHQRAVLQNRIHEYAPWSIFRRKPVPDLIRDRASLGVRPCLRPRFVHEFVRTLVELIARVTFDPVPAHGVKVARGFEALP